MRMDEKSFVRDYALTSYTFDGGTEDYLIARLIFRNMKGRRILNLGCGPIEPVISVFYPNPKEVVAVDRLKANLDFAKHNANELSDNITRAERYRHRYLSRTYSRPRIRYVKGDVAGKFKLGKFDSVMQIGCFACLTSVADFQKAVDNTYDYLRKGGTLLMVNWKSGDMKVKRPYKFNGPLSSYPERLYRPSLENAGFRVKEMHTTSSLLGKGTRKMGYIKIVWAIAVK